MYTEPSKTGMDDYIMSEFGIKRLDHHGIVMGVIQDLGIIDQIDERLGTYKDEKLSVGNRIAAMILNGLGFTDQPLSLVPEFFEELPMDHFFGEGITPIDFDRFSLSRALDRVSRYGEDTLFSEVAAHACTVSGVDCKSQSVDTTTFSFSGDYDCEIEEGTVNIVHGYSKDKRADLKQIVTELIVSHDGGIPLVLKNWDGNASDSIIFKDRSAALCDAFKNGFVNHLTADSKFYSKENAQYWDIVRFTTRVPETITDTKDFIKKSQEKSEWYESSDGKTKYVVYDHFHYNTQQRWLVCQSKESLVRAEKSVSKAILKEYQVIEKSFFHLQAQRFKCKDDALSTANKSVKKWNYHDLIDFEVQELKRFNKVGYTKGRSPDYYEYKVVGRFTQSMEKIDMETQRKASFVLATNMTRKDLADDEVVAAYKKQQHVERGYRFLKDPQFFANAFFLKSPARISALIMVMTLALLVYSIAQKRVNAAIKKNNIEFKNLAGVMKKSLTVRRAFQLFRGVYTLPSQSTDGCRFLVDGLNAIRVTILNLLKGCCLRFYDDGRRNDLVF